MGGQPGPHPRPLPEGEGTRPRRRLSFPYGAYFADVTVMADLQLPRGERPWRQRPPDGQERHDVVLYLGCNILRTMHLPRTVAAIFQLLEVDFVAVAGPAYCCGIQQHRAQDHDLARRAGLLMVNHVEDFQPRCVVMWCLSCISHYDEVVAAYASGPFAVQHVTEFLAERLHRLPIRPVSERTVALHSHTGAAQRDREARFGRRLLEAIPGVRLVELAPVPELGRHCSYAVQRALGMERWREIVAAHLGQAVDAGAQTLATLYHSCHRELCGLEGDYALTVESYIALLGESLGIVYPDTFKQYTHWADEERIAEASLPCAQGNGVDAARARQAIRRNFCGEPVPWSS